MALKVHLRNIYSQHDQILTEMSRTGTLETRISAVMAFVAGAAVTELRRLLDRCLERTVSAQRCPAPHTGAAGPGMKREEEDPVRPPEDQDVFDEDKATNHFASLMDLWTKDAVEKILMLLKESDCEPEVGFPSQQGSALNDEKKQRQMKPKAQRLAGPRRQSKSSYEEIKEGHLSVSQQEPSYKRVENLTVVPVIDADLESESGQADAAAEDCGTWSPPEATALPTDPHSQLLSSERAEAVVHAEGTEAPANTSKSIKKTTGPFKCPSCDKSFSQKCLKDRHYLTHSKPHLCSECGKRFSGLPGLTAHLRRHSGEKLYTCSECETGFAYKSTFNRHMRQHSLKRQSSQVCSLCEEHFSGLLALQRHRCSALKKTFVCSRCPQTFECHQKLADHENLHSGSRDFVCEICGESFFSSSSLATHRLTHMLKEKCCDVLGLGCSDLSVLKNHLSKHTGEKLFTCEVCGKGCSHRSALKHHMLTHTGERPYVCETCGKRCGHASALQNHLRVHTGKRPGQQPVCDVCGKKFRCTVNLKYHMSIHTGEKPYDCEHCGKKFSNPSNLKAHTMIHTGEKMYGCNVCGRRFTQAISLKLHRRVHTGERPFSCQVCGRGFWNSGDFRKHRHLSEQPGKGQ